MPPGALLEDALRHALLPGAQAEGAELVEPGGDRIADAVRQAARSPAGTTWYQRPLRA